MKQLTGLLVLCILLAGCEIKVTTPPLPAIAGTWQLLTGTIIEKTDTVITDYTKDKKFIKIISGNHFSFLGHDLNGGADSTTAFFAAGGGSYTLKDSTYTEHLEFCNDRAWEKHDFTFTVSVNGDTLVQSGTEVVEATGINRLNIEKYVRVKK